ncbi:putative alpha/beta hydrolase [Zalerion maritima]|uniref:Alpha/beta hydrolase n=1 Tax=Zalerion maritima TaxID=339359 RepID=A0AAD5WT33_9PEZI|nr:putative alpha/beta hydrolase [Zalerion maritima]
MSTTASPNTAATTSSTTNDDSAYQNPLDSSPRWMLSARAAVLRYAATAGFGAANFSTRAASKDIWLDTTLSLKSGHAGVSKIRVDIWYPPGVSASAPNKQPSVTTPTSPSSSRETRAAGRPAIINFHGGGFILGQGTDDARWAAEASATLDAVVFSVNYRLAPAYPFPVPVEDCADAILQIVARADEFSVDSNRGIFLSGFSAGGNLALAAWTLLQRPEEWGYELPTISPPPIAGIALFYPSLDFTKTRSDKRAKVSRPDLTLSTGLTDLFDVSYLFPKIPAANRNDPRLSPGLMDDELLAKIPAAHMCICEHDMLAAEGLEFINRLKKLGKPATHRMVMGEQHGWDKVPTFSPKANVAEEYHAALEAMKSWMDG